jgi:hypothetical protein
LILWKVFSFLLTEYANITYSKYKIIISLHGVTQENMMSMDDYNNSNHWLCYTMSILCHVALNDCEQLSVA